MAISTLLQASRYYCCIHASNSHRLPLGKQGASEAQQRPPALDETPLEAHHKCLGSQQR